MHVRAYLIGSIVQMEYEFQKHKKVSRPRRDGIGMLYPALQCTELNTQEGHPEAL